MPSELAAIIGRAIQRGQIGRRLNTPQLKPDWDEHRRLWIIKRRNAFLAKGLTAAGKTRKQSNMRLTGMTAEQKHQRRLQQQREAMRRARHKKTCKIV